MGVRVYRVWSANGATTGICFTTHLERDPKSVYKQLSIKGRRIKARTLYGRFMSEEEPLMEASGMNDPNYKFNPWPDAPRRAAIAFCRRRRHNQ